MALVNTQKMFEMASKGGYAIGAGDYPHCRGWTLSLSRDPF